MWQKTLSVYIQKDRDSHFWVGGESGEEEGWEGITRFLVVLGDINDALRKSMTPNN